MAGDELDDARYFWDRILDGAERINTPASLLSFLLWIGAYSYVCLNFAVGLWAIPLLCLAIILAGSTGLAIEKIYQSGRDLARGPQRMRLFQRRVEIIEQTCRWLPVTKRVAINTKLQGSLSSYTSGFLTAYEMEQRLNEIQAEALTLLQLQGEPDERAIEGTLPQDSRDQEDVSPEQEDSPHGD